MLHLSTEYEEGAQGYLSHRVVVTGIADVTAVPLPLPLPLQQQHQLPFDAQQHVDDLAALVDPSFDVSIRAPLGDTLALLQSSRPAPPPPPRDHARVYQNWPAVDYAPPPVDNRTHTVLGVDLPANWGQCTPWGNAITGLHPGTAHGSAPTNAAGESPGTAGTPGMPESPGVSDASAPSEDVASPPNRSAVLAPAGSDPMDNSGSQAAQRVPSAPMIAIPPELRMEPTTVPGTAPQAEPRTEPRTEPGTDPGTEPPTNHGMLVVACLLEHSKSIMANQVYQWYEDNHSHYRQASLGPNPPKWKAAVRKTLSLYTKQKKIRACEVPGTATGKRDCRVKLTYHLEPAVRGILMGKPTSAKVMHKHKWIKAPLIAYCAKRAGAGGAHA